MNAKIVIIAALSAVLVNCAKNESAPAASSDPVVTMTPGAPSVAIPSNTPYIPSQSGIGYDPGNTFIYGGTGDFTFDSLGVYEEYTQRAIPDLSYVTNVKINLNLTNFGTNSYGGTVTIRYALGGQVGTLYEGYFTSGHDSTSTKYNVWFNKNGKPAWHGFFEDYMGAIVVVVDGVDALADGISSADTVSGSVWFKNFDVQPGFGPHPPTYCWFVSYGPYDCRSWPSGWGVNTTSAVNPNNGYVRLGTFTNVPVTQAFNGLHSL